MTATPKVSIAVGTLARDESERRFTADADTLEALARQFGIEAVKSFSASYSPRRWRRDGVRVAGSIEARIVQRSVVTLEPISQALVEPFDLTFMPAGSRLAQRHLEPGAEIEVDPEAEDPPETFSGDTIDLGPYLCEAMALAIDPYPRERDRDYVDLDTDPEPDGGTVSAFDVLRTLVPPGAGKK